jgi:uncharacterized membrane protein
MAVREAWQTGSATSLAAGKTQDPWAERVAQSEASGDIGLSKALGWFSIALGVAELAAPRGLARLIGVNDDEDNRRLMQAYGLREVATGIGILSQPDQPGWLWARVGGDILDLATLGSAMKSERSQRGRVTAATAAVLGVTALDVITGQRLARRGSNGSQGFATERAQARGIRVQRSLTVRQSPEEVYRFWRDFTNLPRFMSHLESVVITGDQRSRWRAKAPAGTTVEWDAEIVEDRPNELISWRSLPGSEVDNAGSVEFVRAPGDRGTEVRVEFRYDPPGGKLGALVAKLFGEAPEQQVAGDLRRLKQVLETGEVVHSDASIHRGLHPARPPGPEEQITL